MMKTTLAFLLLLLQGFSPAAAQDADALLKRVKAKLEQVNSYEAEGMMKTNVSFLKVPEARVKIYFRKPNDLRIRNEKGLSFVPKGAVSVNLNSIVSGNAYTIIDAGTDQAGGKTTRVIKLLPSDDNADVVLSTLYIDEKEALILKAKTTTRENGSYQLDMQYGKYAAWGLPDKLLFTFNTKDYKLPKGVTFDFDDGSGSAKPAPQQKNGRAEIIFEQYAVNKVLPDQLFR